MQTCFNLMLNIRRSRDKIIAHTYLLKEDCQIISTKKYTRGSEKKRGQDYYKVCWC